MSQDFSPQDIIDAILRGDFNPRNHDYEILDEWFVVNQKFFMVKVTNHSITDWLVENYEVGTEFNYSTSRPRNTMIVVEKVLTAIAMKWKPE